MIRFEVVFLILLLIILNQVHSKSRKYENFRVKPAYKITEVPSPNPDEKTVEKFCGWDTEAELRKTCSDILRSDVFKFNGIAFEEGEKAQPMKKYIVKKSRMGFSTKDVPLCKCPAIPYLVYMGGVTSNINILDVYVVRADFITERKRLKLLMKQKRSEGFNLNKDFPEQNCCERTATIFGILMYPLTCCCFCNCCGKIH